MIFQDSPVIVENGQTTARIDVKVVGCARMVEIVDNGCHQRSEDFQVRHPILKLKSKSVNTLLDVQSVGFEEVLLCLLTPPFWHLLKHLL